MNGTTTPGTIAVTITRFIDFAAAESGRVVWTGADVMRPLSAMELPRCVARASGKSAEL